MDRVVEEQKDAADDVAHERLGAEADGESGHAGCGQQGAHVDAQFAQDHDQAHGPERVAGRRADQVGQRGGALAAGMRGGQVGHALHPAIGGAVDHAQTDQDEQHHQADVQERAQQPHPQVRVAQLRPERTERLDDFERVVAESVGQCLGGVGRNGLEHGCAGRASEQKSQRFGAGRKVSSSGYFLSVSATRPGSFLPSRNSSMAPPPVETWLTRSA